MLSLKFYHMFYSHQAKIYSIRSLYYSLSFCCLPSLLYDKEKEWGQKTSNRSFSLGLSSFSHLTLTEAKVSYCHMDLGHQKGEKLPRCSVYIASFHHKLSSLPLCVPLWVYGEKEQMLTGIPYTCSQTFFSILIIIFKQFSTCGVQFCRFFTMFLRNYTSQRANKRGVISTTKMFNLH